MGMDLYVSEIRKRNEGSAWWRLDAFIHNWNNNGTDQTLMWPQYANLTAQYNKVEDPRHKQANNTHANLYSELQRNKEAGGGDEGS